MLNFSKYRILSKQNSFVQSFFALEKRSFKSIVKNVFDENDDFSTKILNYDSF